MRQRGIITGKLEKKEIREQRSENEGVTGSGGFILAEGS
jgi:hypothetical protein